MVLVVCKFPKTHTAAHLAEATDVLMGEWGIKGKVTGLVTDCAANMIASANTLNVRHIMCITHVLNLIVKKALTLTPELEEMHSRGRRILGHLESSTTAKEKLLEVQRQMGWPEHKLIQEVDTRWNSPFTMLDRLYEEREPLGAALASLNADLVPFSCKDYQAIQQCLTILKPVYQATVELSEDKFASASKVIPLAKMLKHFIEGRCGHITHNAGKTLATNLRNCMAERFSQLERSRSRSLATLLDPRFKQLGFCSQEAMQVAV